MSISDDVVYMTDRDDSVAVAYTLEGRPLMVLGERGVHSDTAATASGTWSHAPRGRSTILPRW